MFVFKKVCKAFSGHVHFLFTIIKDLIEYAISQIHDLNSAFKTHLSIDLGAGCALMTENLADR